MSNPPFSSPHVDNYYVGKGNIYFKLPADAEAAYAHAGNVPKFEARPSRR
jgi:hypothetical protein